MTLWAIHLYLKMVPDFSSVVIRVSNSSRTWQTSLKKAELSPLPHSRNGKGIAIRNISQRMASKSFPNLFPQNKWHFLSLLLFPILYPPLLPLLNNMSFNPSRNLKYGAMCN